MNPRRMARAILEAVDDAENDARNAKDADRDEERDGEGIVPAPPTDIDKVVADEPDEDPPFAPDANMTIKDQEEPVSDAGNDVEAKVLDFIVGERAPDDAAVHGFARELGMEPDDLEGVVYSILGSLAAGKARAVGLRKENVDPDELAKGIEVEAEHTGNRAVAEMIAMDHLAEIPDYYTRLDEMEKRAKDEGSSADIPGEGDEGPPRSSTSWPKGKREPYHSLDPHDGVGEDDGW